MRIEQLFKKDITRNIQGVVKIGQDDADTIQQELEEYVVTEELEEHFETFFDSYKRAYQFPTDKVGVWISGFFGSGKSHFLKILSYLLNSGIKVGGRQPVTYFEDKINHSETLLKMKQITAYSSEVVLFNIDSKTEADGKLNKEAIVKVFNKVFNEMRGYSATTPWLAQLEEILERNGEYASFKNAFEKETGLAWEEGRDEIFYNRDKTVLALSKSTSMTEESAARWIDDGEDNYSISVDSFARRLKKYVESKDENYRLIFAADEVGQYISDNTQLMLNLQTVVEDLGKYCAGKVWILVTSQQDINSLKENMSSTDFSKIQGRFNTRVNLSSANADEVIKIRLLEKRNSAFDMLTLTYDDKEATLKNKLEFDEHVPKGFRFFTDREDFARVYPFVPYQFHLLQKVFTAIREHGSAGKHLSDGERNLLESIQQATISNKDEKIGQLVPFSSFYTHIDQALEHSVRSTIIKAEKNEALDNFDVNILKLLFLIRYVDEIPGTIKNLTTLMINHVEEDVLEKEKRIKNSLQLLEDEFYIQRIGTRYQFLTNEEQDVNRRIQNIQIPTSELIIEVGHMLIEEVLNLRKFSYQPYPDKKQLNYLIDLSQWIDDRNLQNPTIDFGVKYVSVYSEVNGETDVIGESIQSPKVIVRLPDEYDFDELRHVNKINAYLREQSAKTPTPVVQEINNQKAQERSQIQKNFKNQLIQAVQYAAIYINGNEIEAKGAPTKRLEVALRKLVESTYEKIKYIKKSYTKDELEKLITNDQLNLLREKDRDINHEATSEIERYLEMQDNRNIQSTILDLILRFSKEPYGWKELDVLASLIQLIHAERIHFVINSRKMDLFEVNFLRQILKKNIQEKIIVQKRKVIDPRVLQTVKNLTKEIFAITAIGEKEDEIAETVKNKFEHEKTKLQSLMSYYERNSYPEKEIVREAINDFSKLININDSTEFLINLADRADEIVETSEDLEDIKSFMNGDQRKIYERAIEVNELYKEDQHYLDNRELEYIAQSIQEILKMNRPYSKMTELAEFVDRFNLEMGQHLENVTVSIRDKVEQDKNDIEIQLRKLEGSLEKEKIQKSYAFKVNDLDLKINHAKTVGKLRSFELESQQIKTTILRQIESAKEKINERKVKEKKVTKDNSEAKDSTNPNTGLKDAVNEDDYGTIEDRTKKEKKMFVQKQFFLPNGSQEIRTSEDIDDYLETIRFQLEEKLKEVDLIYLT